LILLAANYINVGRARWRWALELGNALVAGLYLVARWFSTAANNFLAFVDTDATQTAIEARAGPTRWFMALLDAHTLTMRLSAARAGPAYSNTAPLDADERTNTGGRGFLSLFLLAVAFPIIIATSVVYFFLARAWFFLRSGAASMMQNILVTSSRAGPESFAIAQWTGADDTTHLQTNRGRDGPRHASPWTAATATNRRRPAAACA
jgi:hypothetical protein